MTAADDVAQVTAMLLARAESYARDARTFADMPRLGQTSEALTEDDCRHFAVMYRTIADELRKVAASLQGR